MESFYTSYGDIHDYVEIPHNMDTLDKTSQYDDNCELEMHRIEFRSGCPDSFVTMLHIFRLYSDHNICEEVQYCDRVIVHDYPLHNELGIYLSNVSYAIVDKTADAVIDDIFKGDFRPYMIDHMPKLLT
jgi:hypothetical protein